MKWLIPALAALAICLPRPAPAGDTATVLGALIGAGAGVALGNEMGDVNPVVAAPVLAVAGGLLGRHLIDKPREERHELERKLEQARQPREPQRVEITNRHPGVDLVKVTIMNSNGVQSDVPILRLGGKFVGPQGETYPALPTSAELAAKYGH